MARTHTTTAIIKDQGGVLLVHKPQGPTSHDIVAGARRHLGGVRIGHCGTLDPMASGLLVLCIGECSRLARFFTGHDKSYETVALLGKRTDTYDVTGTIINEEDTSHVSSDRIREAAAALQGQNRYHVPPAFSAKKLGGRKLCDLAREGIMVEANPVRVNVHSVEVVDCVTPRVRMLVRCSAGTYIRTLVHELGEMIGCGATMEFLSRTNSGAWSLTQAITYETLLTMDQKEILEHVINPVSSVASCMPTLTCLNDTVAHKAWNGRPLSPLDIKDYPEEAQHDHVAVCDFGSQDRLIGIFKPNHVRELVPDMIMPH